MNWFTVMIVVGQAHLSLAPYSGWNLDGKRYELYKNLECLLDMSMIPVCHS